MVHRSYIMGVSLLAPADSKEKINQNGFVPLLH
jgi:hypothetical protein